MQQADVVGGDLRRVGITPSDGVAAVEVLADGEDRAGGGHVGSVDRLGAKYRTKALEPPCIDLVLACLTRPGSLGDDFLFGLAKIHEAELPEVGFAAGSAVHVALKAKAFQGQRESAFVAAHRTAPAPVARGLLRANLAFFATGDGDAFLGEEQGGGDTDDAA